MHGVVVHECTVTLQVELAECEDTQGHKRHGEDQAEQRIGGAAALRDAEGAGGAVGNRKTGLATAPSQQAAGQISHIYIRFTSCSRKLRVDLDDSAAPPPGEEEE